MLLLIYLFPRPNSYLLSDYDTGHHSRLILFCERGAIDNLDTSRSELKLLDRRAIKAASPAHSTMPFILDHEQPHRDLQRDISPVLDENPPSQRNNVLCRCRWGCVCSSSYDSDNDIQDDAPYTDTNSSIDEHEYLTYHDDEDANSLHHAIDLDWHNQAALHRVHQDCGTCICANLNATTSSSEYPQSMETSLSSLSAHAGSNAPPTVESSMHLSPRNISTTDLLRDLQDGSSFPTSTPCQEGGCGVVGYAGRLSVSVNGMGDCGEWDFW